MSWKDWRLFAALASTGVAAAVIGGFDILSNPGDIQVSSWSWKLDSTALLMGCLPFAAFFLVIFRRRGGRLKVAGFEATLQGGTEHHLQRTSTHYLFMNFGDFENKDNRPTELEEILPRVQAAETHAMVVDTLLICLGSILT